MENEFISKVISRLERGDSSFRVVGQLSGLNYYDMSATSTCGSPLVLDAPLEDVKVRCQGLISGARFETGDCRIDNCHGEPLHMHLEPFKAKIQLGKCEKLGDVIEMFVGPEIKQINRKLSRK